MHLRSRKPLQDVLTATRLGRPVRECGWALQPNAEAHLRSRMPGRARRVVWNAEDRLMAMMASQRSTGNCSTGATC